MKSLASFPKPLLVALFLIASLGWSVGGLGKTYYRVRKVEGEVWAWDRFAAAWTLVEERATLSDSALVQMKTGAKLTLAAVNRTGAPQDLTDLSLVATEPTITRVAPQYMKKPELGGFFLSLPDDAQSQVAKGDDPPSLADAWRRLVSVFNFDTKPEDVAAPGELGGSPTSMTKKPNHLAAQMIVPITITHPASGATYLVDRFPAEFAVVWQPLGSSESYRVFLGSADQTDEELVGTTRDRSLKVQVPRKGRYSVRVEALEGRAQSRRHIVVIDSLLP